MLAIPARHHHDVTRGNIQCKMKIYGVGRAACDYSLLYDSIIHQTQFGGAMSYSFEGFT